MCVIADFHVYCSNLFWMLLKTGFWTSSIMVGGYCRVFFLLLDVVCIFVFNFSYFSDLNALDLGVSSPRSRGHKYLSSSYASSLGYPRPTTATSYYHSTLADRFGDRAYSPTASQIISSRVDQAIQHHRSLERLNDTYGRTKVR